LGISAQGRSFSLALVEDRAGAIMLAVYTEFREGGRANFRTGHRMVKPVVPGIEPVVAGSYRS
jgi:hypothetical protein